jgi:hypothetical protein
VQEWQPERTVRASVLRHLLVADEWPMALKGVRLRGAQITERLDIEGAALRCPLHLDSCYLDANEPACFDFATASGLTLTRSRLAGLTAEMLVARDLNLNQSALAGALRLAGARITGKLSCEGAKLAGRDEDGDALNAARMKVGGDVLLDKVRTTRGAIELESADITGMLSCQGAHLDGSDKNRYALSAFGITVGSDARLDEGFTAAGAVELSRASPARSAARAPSWAAVTRTAMRCPQPG